MSLINVSTLDYLSGLIATVQLFTDLRSYLYYPWTLSFSCQLRPSIWKHFKTIKSMLHRKLSSFPQSSFSTLRWYEHWMSFLRLCGSDDPAPSQLLLSPGTSGRRVSWWRQAGGSACVIQCELRVMGWMYFQVGLIIAVSIKTWRVLYLLYDL